MTIQALDEVTAQIQRYLLVQVVLGVLVAVATWLCFLWIGVEQAAVWGIVAGILNFIPYIGAIVFTAVSAAVGLIQFGNLESAVIVASVSLVIHTISGYVLMPWLTSRTSRMNAVTVFIGVLVWGWLWGLWGLLLGVPILMIVKAVCDRVEDLKPLGELLAADVRRRVSETRPRSTHRQAGALVDDEQHRGNADVGSEVRAALADVHAEAHAEATPEDDEQGGARIDARHVPTEGSRAAEDRQPEPDGHDGGRGDFVERGLAQRDAEKRHGELEAELVMSAGIVARPVAAGALGAPRGTRVTCNPHAEDYCRVQAPPAAVHVVIRAAHAGKRLQTRHGSDCAASGWMPSAPAPRSDRSALDPHAADDTLAQCAPALRAISPASGCTRATRAQTPDGSAPLEGLRLTKPDAVTHVQAISCAERERTRCNRPISAIPTTSTRSSTASGPARRTRRFPNTSA